MLEIMSRLVLKSGITATSGPWTKPWSYAFAEVVHAGDLVALHHDVRTGRSVATLRNGAQVEYGDDGGVIAETWPPPSGA